MCLSVSEEEGKESAHVERKSSWIFAASIGRYARASRPTGGATSAEVNLQGNLQEVRSV